MSRNLYFDLDKLIGCKLQSATTVEVSEGRFALHVLTEEDEAIEDWGTRAAEAYEYAEDLPAALKHPDGTPKHGYLGVPVYQNKTERLSAAAPEVE